MNYKPYFVCKNHFRVSSAILHHKPITEDHRFLDFPKRKNELKIEFLFTSIRDEYYSQGKKISVFANIYFIGFETAYVL